MPPFDPARRFTIAGVLHLGELLGQAGYAGQEALVAAARADAEALAEGGVDALLLENWKDASPGPFLAREQLVSLATAAEALARTAPLPLGINVLPNDYPAAFALARACGLAFVQLDVMVDRVRTDYSYSDAPPFDVVVDLDDLAATRRRLGAEAVPLLATVHPKHYALLDDQPLETSARRAVAHGAQALVVTGSHTGRAPDPERLRRVRSAAPGTPVWIGSGLDPENAADLVPLAEGAIVGTALRGPDMGPVEVARVRALVERVRAAAS